MRHTVVIVLAGLLVAGCGKQTHWAEDGLLGQVKTVKTELAHLTGNPHPVDGGRILLTHVAYDQKGIRLQRSCYWVDKSPAGAAFVITDGEGRRLEIANYYKDGSVDSKLITTFDAIGQKTNELLFDTDGSIGERVVYEHGEIQGVIGSVNSPKWRYTYDKRNRKVTKRLSDVDAAVLLQSTYAYDAGGRLLEVSSTRDKDDVSLGQWTFGYDTRGRKTDAAFYGSGGQELVRWRYQYEFDRKGNWITRTVERMVQQDEQLLWRPTEIIYREIAYWDGWWSKVKSLLIPARTTDG